MKNLTQWYEVRLRLQEGGGLSASTVHYGGYESLHDAYDFLNEWIRDHGYRIQPWGALYGKDCIRAIYLIGGDCTRDKAQYQTKLEVEIIRNCDKVQ